MWQLDNETPFAADRTWTRDRNGAEVWLVAVKCTFDIKENGETAVATDQPPVVMVPEYMDPGKPAQSSLKYANDLVRTKVTTDVLVLGRAYSPSGEPVTEVEVGLQAGAIVKRLRVTGDRTWREGSISAPEPFVEMPIVYERAYGGMDPKSRGGPTPQWDMRNPIGTGFALSESGAERLALPNIEYPDRLIRRVSDRPPPAGLGPLDAHWQPRAQLAGTYDERWQQDRFPLLPHDFRDEHYQCAPADQQAPAFLKGGERVTLANLTPAGRLTFALPTVFLGFETTFHRGPDAIHDKARLHTVIIEPDVPRVSLVWHTALPCHPRVYKLKETRIIEKELLRA